MKQKMLAGIALLVIGAILIYFGLNAADSPTEKITESLTGRYSDNTMFYLIGGAVSAAIGLFLTLKK